MLSTTASSCAQLDPYPVDVCGNAVVDNDGGALSEQCDTHVASGEQCGAPGAPGACRYVCPPVDAIDPLSSRVPCPAGFACGLDAICHQATGAFAIGSIETNFAFGSRLGDFDGSGTADVLTAGLSRLDISYVDAEGAIAARQSLGGGLLLLPEVGHLDGPGADGIAYEDAVFTKDGDVVVALGTGSGLVPKSYAGVRLGIAPPVRFFSVPGAVSPGNDLHAALGIGGVDPVGVVVLDGDEVRVVIADWPIPDALPYHVLSANLDPSSPGCHEVVLSYGGFLALWRPCPEGDQLAELDGFEDPIGLGFAAPEGTTPVQAGAPAAVDLDADGVLDLVVEINECFGDRPLDRPQACDLFTLEVPPGDESCCVLYVGWGQADEQGVATGRFASSRDEDTAIADALGPWKSVALPGEEGRFFLHPIAWGDFDGDPWPDFVSPYLAVLGAEPETWALRAAAPNPGLPWFDVAIGDIDDDGLDDVLAVPFVSPSLDYLRGDPGGTMSRAGIQVERPFSDVLLGDFDGDARLDIAGRTITPDGANEELSILFFDDGTFSAQQPIGRFPIEANDPADPDDDASRILQIAAAPLVTNADPLDDLAVITTYDEGDGDKVAIALYEGRPDRQLVAPIIVTSNRKTTDVGVTTFGSFDAAGPTIVADHFALQLDPASLELSGEPVVIAPLVGVAAAFSPGAAPFPKPGGAEGAFELTVVTAGNLDDDAFDELVVAVPGCVQATDCGSPRACCQDGTEETRLLLLERNGGAFTHLASAPAPLALPGAVAQAFLEGDLVSLSRLAVIDVNGDGRGEVLATAGSRQANGLVTRGHLIANVGGIFAALALPEAVTLGGELFAVDIHGFAALSGADGEPAIALATSAGLFAVTVDRETFALGEPTPVLDDLGQPLALGQVSNVESADVTGDGIVDLVLTRPFATEIYVGGESFAPPQELP